MGTTSKIWLALTVFIMVGATVIGCWLYETGNKADAKEFANQAAILVVIMLAGWGVPQIIRHA